MGVADNRRAWQSDSVAQVYDERRFSSLTGRIFDALEKRAIARFLDQIERHQDVDKVLDVPCGTGRISEMLLARGYEVVGGDISEEMMKVADSKFVSAGYNRYKLEEVDVFALPYADRSFDCVTCIRLFQHFDSDERVRALRELSRVSKRYVIANVTYVSPYYALIRKIRKALRRYAPKHTISAAQMDHELEASGLRLVASSFPQPGYNSNLMLLLEKLVAS